MKQTTFKLAELFCGPGGLGWGASAAKALTSNSTYQVKSVWANDIDPWACKTYARNLHPDNLSAVVCAPIQDIEFNTIPNFDSLAFGFACNDFSIVGEQKGFDGSYGALYTYGVKAINLHNPKWFIAENVSGLQSANKGTAFKKILNDLSVAGEGYELTSHLYKFEDYGVPQYRHRIVIIGIRKDLGLSFKVPAPTTKGNHITAKHAIESPSIMPNSPNNEITR